MKRLISHKVPYRCRYGRQTIETCAWETMRIVHRILPLATIYAIAPARAGVSRQSVSLPQLVL